MKSVIINLKYLIFRSVSASEGGCLEEQQRRGEGGGGAVPSALSASAALKSGSTRADAQRCCLASASSEVRLPATTSRPGGTTLFHFWWGGFGFGFGIALCPLAPSLNSIPSPSISSREAECPCDKVWGLSASDWQACSHHASACCLIRENVSVIWGNVIYRGFLAVSVTQTDYGCWTFISLGVPWKIVQMLCFSVITPLNIPFAVMDLILFSYLFSSAWIVSTSYATYASLFYETRIRHVEACTSRIPPRSQTKTTDALLIVQNRELKCACLRFERAPDSNAIC